VVEYREGLQLAWEDTSASHSLAQLREWCRRAEDSGIAALREFARGLPAYASVRG
jgi:stearoyl-CoA desaturase (delta-9 desaturase)